MNTRMDVRNTDERIRLSVVVSRAARQTARRLCWDTRHVSPLAARPHGKLSSSILYVPPKHTPRRATQLPLAPDLKTSWTTWTSLRRLRRDARPLTSVTLACRKACHERRRKPHLGSKDKHADPEWLFLDLPGDPGDLHLIFMDSMCTIRVAFSIMEITFLLSKNEFFFFLRSS